jgi:hypothetical protein
MALKAHENGDHDFAELLTARAMHYIDDSAAAGHVVQQQRKNRAAIRSPGGALISRQGPPLHERGALMSIRVFLDAAFTREEVQILVAAFEDALKALGLVDREDAVDGVPATFTSVQLRWLLGLSNSRLEQLTTAGVITRIEKGSYTANSIRRYVKHSTARGTGKPCVPLSPGKSWRWPGSIALSVRASSLRRMR